MVVIYEGTIPTIITEHAGEQIFWSGKHYIRREIGIKLDIVRHINDFWSKLSQAAQSRIFEIYKRIFQIMEVEYDIYKLILALRPYIADLMYNHREEDIAQWYTFTTEPVYIPSDIKTTFLKNTDTPGTRERTYLKEDYIQLIYLVMQLRALIPIWGEMIYKIADGVETSKKEYTVYQIITMSNIVNSNGVIKLLTYIGDAIKASDNTGEKRAAIAVDGVGWEELPQHILATVLVNRICVGDLMISATELEGGLPYHLVVAVFKEVSSKISAISQTSVPTGDQVKIKEPIAGDASDEASLVEGFKVRQMYPAGVYLPFCIFTENTEQFLKSLNMYKHVSLYVQLRNNFDTIPHFSVSSSQIKLTQYVVANVIPAEMFSYLNRKQLLNTMALAQTWMWVRGHRSLAALLSAMPAVSSDTTFFSGSTTLNKLTMELKDKIISYYPYSYHARAKSNKPKNNHIVLAAIGRISDELNSHDWVVCLPQELSCQIFTRVGATTRIPCPTDVRTLIGVLVLDIAETIYSAKPISVNV